MNEPPLLRRLEHLALGNHGEAVRSEIAKATEETRELQLQVLRDVADGGVIELGPLSPGAFLFLLTGVPRLVRIEKGVGVTTAHDDVLETFERYLRAADPRKKRSDDD